MRNQPGKSAGLTQPSSIDEYNALSRFRDAIDKAYGNLVFEAPDAQLMGAEILVLGAHAVMFGMQKRSNDPFNMDRFERMVARVAAYGRDIIREISMRHGVPDVH